MILVMAWLNYHHLYYFWTVVREGTISAAGRALRLAQPTVSGQLKELEDALGVELFHRRGRRLVITDAGAHVYRYADEIFTLGRELQDSLAGGFELPRSRLVVGVSDIIPKAIVQTLVEPALLVPPESPQAPRQSRAARVEAKRKEGRRCMLRVYGSGPGQTTATIAGRGQRHASRAHSLSSVAQSTSAWRRDSTA